MYCKFTAFEFKKTRCGEPTVTVPAKMQFMVKLALNSAVEESWTILGCSILLLIGT